VNNGAFTYYLPDGLLLKNWSVSYANGAAGPASGNMFPFVIPTLPVTGKAVITVEAWIEPDACLGALTGVAKYFYPNDVDHVDGSSCLSTGYDFQVVDALSEVCVDIGNCLSGWLCDDPSAPVGYVVVRLVTPGGSLAYSAGRNRSLIPASYRVEISNTGCWTVTGLPVNSQLVTKRNGEPIPSFYEIYEYAYSPNTSVVGDKIVSLISQYRVRLSSDNVYIGTVNVRDIDELSPVVKGCISGGQC
jgi:hypothetical protein